MHHYDTIDIIRDELISAKEKESKKSLSDTERRYRKIKQKKEKSMRKATNEKDTKATQTKKEEKK